MRGHRPVLVAVLGLWIAGALQQAWAHRLMIGPILVDFPLVLLAALAPLLGRRGGAVLGFGAGLVHGALAGAHLGAYVVTRAFVGFLLGWFRDLEFDASPAVVVAAGAAATVISGLMMVIVAPPPTIGAFLFGTLGAAVVNGVLAVPVHALLRRFVGRESM